MSSEITSNKDIHSKLLVAKIRSGAKLLTIENILNISGFEDCDINVILSTQSEKKTWLNISSETSKVFLTPFVDCLVESIEANSDKLQIWLLTDDVTGELIRKSDVENGIISEVQ